MSRRTKVNPRRILVKKYQTAYEATFDSPTSDDKKTIETALQSNNADRGEAFLLAVLNKTSTENSILETLVNKLFEFNLLDGFVLLIRFMLHLKDQNKSKELFGLLINHLEQKSWIPETSKAVIGKLISKEIDDTQEEVKEVDSSKKADDTFYTQFETEVKDSINNPVALLFILTIVKDHHFSRTQIDTQKLYSIVTKQIIALWSDLTQLLLTQENSLITDAQTLEAKALIFLLERESGLDYLMRPMRVAIAKKKTLLDQIHAFSRAVLPMHNLFEPQLVIEWTLAKIAEKGVKAAEPSLEKDVKAAELSLEEDYIQAEKAFDWETLNPITTYMRLERSIQQSQKENQSDLSDLKTLLQERFGITDSTDLEKTATKIANIHDSKRSLTLYMIAELAYANDQATIARLTSSNNPKLDVISQRRHSIYDAFRSILMSLTIFKWLFHSRSLQPLLNGIDKKVHSRFTGSTTRKIFSILAHKRENQLPTAEQDLDLSNSHRGRFSP